VGRDNEAKKYRERAKQLRSIELDVRSAADRKTLQAIARDFDRMAADAETDRKQAARAKGRK
jgi:Ribonuclease G/E